MINLSVSHKCPESVCDVSLTDTIAQILHMLSPSNNNDVSIIIDDDAFIKEFNYNFRGINAPTDVLSFSSDEIDPDTNNRYLGDVIISYEKVISQSTSHNASEKCELLLLITHGILHLLGYDHDNDSGKEAMWSQQLKILDSFGCSISGDL